MDMATFDALKNSRIELNVQSLESASFVLQGSDLVIVVPGEDDPIVISNYAIAVESGSPLELVTTDGVVSELDELQAAIDASSIGEVAPAAGPAGGNGGTGGGAGFAPNNNEGIGEGIGIDGLLAGTELEFGGEEAEEIIQPLVAEAAIETDPCNEMFEEKVAAFRSTFRGDPEFDNPNGFRYYNENDVVSGDGNDPAHASNIPSFSGEHGIELDADGSLAQGNDLMNASNIEPETRIIVGDEYVEENTYENNNDLDFSAAFIGENQVVSVFNDNIQGTDNTIGIFGDAFIESDPDVRDAFEVESEFDISASNTGDEGATNNNNVTAYSDEIIAGVNTKVISGDIGRVTEDYGYGDNSNAQIGISVTHSFSDDDGSTEARNNVYSANEDLIDASGVNVVNGGYGDGAVIAGDALTGGTSLVQDNMYGIRLTNDPTGSLRISLTVEYTVSFTGESVYADNELRAMNDLIIGSDGFDLIAGDAILATDVMYGGDGNDQEGSSVDLDFEVDLDATGSVYYDYSTEEATIQNGGTIENNVFTAHNDVIEGGGGLDYIAGDIINITNNRYRDADEYTSITMEVSASFDAVGSHNYIKDEETTELVADGGVIRNNTISAYNDIIRGDDGTDDGMYGGMDFLVGDVLVSSDVPTFVEFDAGFDVSQESDQDPAGVVENNSITAWNDTLIGGAGNDIMVGDAAFLGGSDNYIEITVSSDDLEDNPNAYEEMKLMSDLLCGGDGNDMLFGDFFGNYAFGDEYYNFNENSNTSEFGPGVDFLDDEGVARAIMFNDTLRGDAGDDMLYGQLGDDILVGGIGADKFIYEGNENWEVSYNDAVDEVDDFDAHVLNDHDAYSEGHDTIQDFNHIAENDFIDLDALFDKLGIENDDNRAYQVNIENNVITVEGVDNFSITVEGDALADVSASDNFDFDQLYDMGINVGGSSFVPDES